MASTNLYPFIIDAYMPAFIRGNDCIIKFKLPTFNSPTEFNLDLIQFTLVNPNNNQSILDNNKYRNNIMMLKANEERDYYTITIKAEDLQNMQLGQFYKVQIRGTSSSLSVDSFKDTASWFTENADNFSEWSTTCLIRAISRPTLNIKELEEAETTPPAFLSQFSAILSFEDPAEDEFLNSYQISIYENENKLVEKSDVLYTNFNSPNQFTYFLKYQLKNNRTYKFSITYSTINGYTEECIYNIQLSIIDSLSLIGTIDAIPDNDNGEIKIITSILTNKFSHGTLYIKRTSFETSFDIWEVIHKVDIEFMNSFLNYIFKDRTAESGILYKYSIQYKDDKETIEYTPIISTIVMINLDDIYLLNKNIQLKIKFNPNISSYKYNVTESVTPTLGGKYPFVRRNGNNKYRTFSISGLISFLSDPDEDITDGNYLSDSIKQGVKIVQNSIFLSKSEAFKNALSIYNQYNIKNNISEYNDYIFEKIFRDKAIDFLYDNTVKLFRSNTEGNILVTLSNISFTPNASLGRRIYSFSATATEIDECNIDNYFKYNIITNPEGELESYYVIETVKSDTDNKNGYNMERGTVYISEEDFINEMNIALKEEKYQK